MAGPSGCSTCSHGPDEGWQVETRHVLLDAEQRRMVTAFMQAVDERRWEEAEAWMAEEAMPRFKGYQLEVETFLKGSAFLSETRKGRSPTLRETEWEDVMLWAEREPDGTWWWSTPNSRRPLVLRNDPSRTVSGGP